MSRQLALLLIAIGIGIITALNTSKLDLSVAADKAPIVVAVFMAALFVRLARGVPTFPFDKIPQQNAEAVLRALKHLRDMYALAFGSFMAALVVSIAYKPLTQSTQNTTLLAALAGVLAALLVWSVATAYLIYRTDISLFKAQSAAFQKVVDDLAAGIAATSVDTVRKNLSVVNNGDGR